MEERFTNISQLKWPKILVVRVRHFQDHNLFCYHVKGFSWQFVSQNLIKMCVLIRICEFDMQFKNAGNYQKLDNSG